MVTDLKRLKSGLQTELESDILPFWAGRMPDSVNGGFIGRISGNGVPDVGAVKGTVLNARILWTFSSAYRIFGREDYLRTATRAKREIIDRFYDGEYGGVYWALKPGWSSGCFIGQDDIPGQRNIAGRTDIADAKKQIYALGFAIYGLAEYARATGDGEALEYAIKLFEDIETHSFDHKLNGYFEAFERDWKPIGDMRLSEKDRNDCKTANTHLHIIEPYTALYRVWKNPRLAERLRNLLNLFTDKILDTRTGHLNLFFNENWESTSDIVSYGHDIEASWLLWETAETLGDKAVMDRLQPIVIRIAEAAAQGYVNGRGMAYEYHPDSARTDADRHWWVQAESIVGYFNIWQLTGEESTLEKVMDCWDFVQKHKIDHNGGEWYWSMKADGTPNVTDDKAGFWKCPYHNGRMCMELIERISKLNNN